MISLKVIDLSKAHEHEHPDIRTDGTQYLARYDGRWMVVTFGRVWFGLTASGGWVSPQFDAPGWNDSPWEELLEICEGPDMEPDTRNFRKVRIKK